MNVTISSPGPLSAAEVRRAVKDALAYGQNRLERDLDAAVFEWMVAGTSATVAWMEAMQDGDYVEFARQGTRAAACFAHAAMVRPIFAVCVFLDRMARS